MMRRRLMEIELDEKEFEAIQKGRRKNNDECLAIVVEAADGIENGSNHM